jgi:UDP-N-acetylglucosamine 2-epimerase (non-hydrolysing)
MTKKVMFIFGTRPEAIKLAPLILEMRRDGGGLEPMICVTGQHRQMLDQILHWFNITPDRDLDLMQKDQSLFDFAGRALSSLCGMIRGEKPDLILVQGDTTTAMIAALAGFYERVPVGHVEAGLRTGDLYNPFPEEMNRRVAGVVASYHFAPTEQSAHALLAEGVAPDRVFVVGNTVIDALRLTINRPIRLDESCRPTNGRRLILITAHRRESFGAPFESICHAIRKIAVGSESVELIYPVHMNPNVREPVMRYLAGHPRIRLTEPLAYEQFVHLMSKCDLILTDSGGIQEEATALRKPTLIMRNTTERSEAIRAGTAVLVGTETENIVQAVENLLRDKDAYRSMTMGECPFGDGHSAEHILTILRDRLFTSGGEPVRNSAHRRWQPWIAQQVSVASKLDGASLSGSFKRIE